MSRCTWYKQQRCCKERNHYQVLIFFQDLHTECDRFVEVGYFFNCWNAFGQGTHVEVQWDFGDGSKILRIKMSGELDEIHSNTFLSSMFSV